MKKEKSQQILKRELVKDPIGLRKLQKKILDNTPSNWREFCKQIHKKIKQMKGSS